MRNNRIIKALTALVAAVLLAFSPMTANAGTTWYFGSGSWGQCYRWADNDEAHMRCQTASAYWPTVNYRTVTTWYDTVRQVNYTVYGSLRQVDGGWGPWSDGYSGSVHTVLVKDSYYLSW